MKKLTSIILCILLVFSLFSCSGDKPQNENAPPKPPAFSVLHKGMKLQKRAEKGQSASFTQQEFENFIGEKPEYIVLSELPDAESGSLLFNGCAVIKGQTLPANQLEYLKFVPKGDIESVSFVFGCKSESYSEDSFTCEIIYKEGVNSPPVASDCEMKTVSGIMCQGFLNINEPNGDDYTINIITYPEGFVSVSADGKVLYTPKEDFSGEDRLVYSVSDKYGETSASAIMTINVAKNEKGLVFQDMMENPEHFYAYSMCQDDTMVYRIENGKYYFDPDSPVSKVEFLVMLMNSCGLDKDIVAVADSVISDDVGLSSGLKGYISAAAESGLILLENGSFNPKEQITFSDAAYMVATALELPYRTSADGNNINASVSAVCNADIFQKDWEISSGITKAQAAKILYKIQSYMSENNMER